MLQKIQMNFFGQLLLLFGHSVVSVSLRPHGLQHARFLCPSPTPELAQTHVHWVGDAIQPSHLLSSPSPPAFNLSHHQGLFNESVHRIRYLKYWNLRFSISPSNECSGLISFRIDWFDVLEVQVTLKSLLQYHSLKASTLWCSVFFMVQLSYPYMNYWKNHSFD